MSVETSFLGERKASSKNPKEGRALTLLSFSADPAGGAKEEKGTEKEAAAGGVSLQENFFTIDRGFGGKRSIKTRFKCVQWNFVCVFISEARGFVSFLEGVSQHYESRYNNYKIFLPDRQRGRGKSLCIYRHKGRISFGGRPL